MASTPSSGDEVTYETGVIKRKPANDSRKNRRLGLLFSGEDVQRSKRHQRKGATPLGVLTKPPDLADLPPASPRPLQDSSSSNNGHSKQISAPAQLPTPPGQRGVASLPLKEQVTHWKDQAEKWYFSATNWEAKSHEYKQRAEAWEKFANRLKQKLNSISALIKEVDSKTDSTINFAVDEAQGLRDKQPTKQVLSPAKPQRVPKGRSKKQAPKKKMNKKKTLLMRSVNEWLATYTYTLDHLVVNIPNHPLSQEQAGHELMSLWGPTDTQIFSYFQDRAAAATISTYPLLPGKSSRFGDPVCDRYQVKLYENRTIICVTDGCNWGVGPKVASEKANRAFTNYVIEQQGLCDDIHTASLMLIKALSCAHEAVIADLNDPNINRVGQTTLCGGLVLSLNRAEDPFLPELVFLCISVGDCKAFLWPEGKDKQVHEITLNNRGSIDCKDSGGRIGPYDGAKADLSNLSLYYTPCRKGDIIFLVSDGVHDNFDPHYMGLDPKKYTDYDSWEDVPDHVREAARIKVISKRINQAKNPKALTDILMRHCEDLTKKSREFMQSTGDKVPEDYTAYPGKMDHTTCAAFRV